MIRMATGAVVTSAGNDRTANRDANDSNFTNTHHTIAVAAMSQDNSVSDYSTPGAAVLVSATSNGPSGSGIWTTDVLGAEGYDGSDHTGTFGGTSAATLPRATTSTPRRPTCSARCSRRPTGSSTRC